LLVCNNFNSNNSTSKFEPARLKKYRLKAMTQCEHSTVDCRQNPSDSVACDLCSADIHHTLQNYIITIQQLVPQWTCNFWHIKYIKLT